MAPIKPTLKRLVGWANGLTESATCVTSIYYWLLNTKDQYKTQHPGQQVPEVNEGTVQRLLKKLIKDQTTKKRTVRRIERTQKRKGRGTPLVLMKSSSYISIPRRTKKWKPSVDENQTRTRAYLLRQKPKREKNLSAPVGFSRREGSRRPKRVEEYVVFKSYGRWEQCV